MSRRHAPWRKGARERNRVACPDLPLLPNYPDHRAHRDCCRQAQRLPEHDDRPAHWAQMADRGNQLCCLTDPHFGSRRHPNRDRGRPSRWPGAHCESAILSHRCVQIRGQPCQSIPRFQ
jgi:hypothetical protein